MPTTQIDFIANTSDIEVTMAPEVAGMPGAQDGATWKRRPQWQKFLRCSGDTSESCEECSGDENCLHAGTPGIDCPEDQNSCGLVLRHDGSGDWTRFLTLLHATCEADRLTLELQAEDINDGEVTAFWDSEEMLASNDRFKVTQKEWKDSQGMPTMTYSWPPTGDEAHFPLAAPVTHFSYRLDFLLDSGSGGHEFLFEFKALGPAASITLDWMAFQVTDAFADCEDSKACLKVLRTEEGLELRNNNALQRDCLGTDEESATGACKTWLTCLRESGSKHGARLKKLLDLAFMGSDTESGKGGKGRSSASAIELASRVGGPSNHSCMDPYTEDPESWNCDCYEDMMKRCKGIEDKPVYTSLDDCMLAQYCMYPRVCDWWKDAACGDANVQAIIDEFNNPTSSLLERASQGHSGLLAEQDQDESVDESLRNKMCV